MEEKERMNKQVVEDLVKTVDQKNGKLTAIRDQCLILRNMLRELNSFRVKAEEGKKRTMEEQYKRDLEAMQLQVQAKAGAQNERLLAHQTALTKNLRVLEGRCKAMKQAEVQMRQKNEAERQRFEREKQDAGRLLEEARMQAELRAAMQRKQRDEQKRIIKKHEGESKALEMAFRDQRRTLIEYLKEMLEDKDKIVDLEFELESLQDMVNALSQKERTANHLLEDARKVAVQVLDTYGVDERIENKLVGSIDKKPWAAACQKKFTYHPDGWKLVMSKIIFEWEDRIGDQGYYPFKMLKVDPEGNEWKRIINEDDEFIKKLKEDLGAEVMQTVATAFFEIEEYNASGRYPMWVAWNFKKNERLQLKDLLLFLKGLLDEATKKPVMAKRKRPRANQ